MIFKADLPGHYLYRAFLKWKDEIIVHRTIHISAISDMKILSNDETSKFKNRPVQADHVYAYAGPDISKCLAAKEVKIQSKNSYSTFKGELEYSWEIKKSPKKSDRAFILQQRYSQCHLGPRQGWRIHNPTASARSCELHGCE